MNIKNFALTGLLFSAVVAANAQQKLSDGTGDNGLSVNQNAILELASKNKGLLHTRVALETTAKAYPMSAHVAGLMVYNTETRNDVVPGIYYNDGTKWVLASGGRATSISYNPTTYEISFIDDTGKPVTIDFKSVVKKNETVTTLVAVGKGEYKYTSEDGTETTINVPADVIQNFETIVKEENVKNEIVNLIKNIGGNVFYDGAKFTYVTNTGETKEITIKEIIQANETETTLTKNTNGTYTYKNEKGIEVIIDIPASVVENFNTIVNEGPVTVNGNEYKTIEEYIQHIANSSVALGGSDFVTVTGTGTSADPYKVSIKEGAANSMLVTNKDGALEWATIESIVKGNETVTTLVKGSDGTYTYTSEDKTVTVIDIPASVVENFNTIVNEGPVTVNGNEYKTIEEYIQHIANSSVALGGSDFVTVTGTGTSADPYKVSIKEGAANSMLVTNKDGALEWATIESIVKGNETVTTLVKGSDGTYTYTSEDKTVTVIDIPASVVENFNTIVNEGPVTVNGNEYKTIEEYIQHIANSSVALGGSDFVTVTGTGTSADPYKVSIKEGAANSMLVTNKDGALEWATIESIVAAKNLTAADGATATIEVVSGGVKAVLVETSLRVKGESITTSQIKNGTILPEDIADAGANQVLVTGDTNKPMWINQSALGNTVTANNGLTKTTNNIQLGGTLVQKTSLGTSSENTLAITGLDKKKTQAVSATQGVTQHLLAVDKNGDVIKALKAAMPKFFYMPSVMVPTAANQVTQSGVTYDNATRKGTIQLYEIYKTQFGTPVMSSTGASPLPVLPAKELGFHVTYATPGVFTITSIDASGLMTYTVSGTANVNVGSFINIVFSVKEDD